MVVSHKFFIEFKIVVGAPSMQMISDIKETFWNFRKGTFCASFHFEHSFLLLLEKNHMFDSPNTNTLLPFPLPIATGWLSAGYRISFSNYFYFVLW